MFHPVSALSLSLSLSLSFARDDFLVVTSYPTESINQSLSLSLRVCVCSCQGIRSDDLSSPSSGNSQASTTSCTSALQANHRLSLAECTPFSFLDSLSLLLDFEEVLLSLLLDFE